MAAESKETPFFIGYAEIIDADIPVPHSAITRSLTEHVDDADGSTEHLKTSSADPKSCKQCRKNFATREGLEEHFAQSSKHFYCQRCSQHFTTATEYDSHLEMAHHFCTVCYTGFEYKKALYKHSQKEHPYCDLCKKAFSSQNHLDAHLKSHAHVVGTIECPAGFFCRSPVFLTRGDLALHWEAGRCASELDRTLVNIRVVAFDKDHTFINPERLPIHDRTDLDVLSRGVVLGGGRPQKCMLCRRTFKTGTALKAHLQSSVHEKKIYRCPPHEEGCGAEFATLSAVMQHAESQRCGVDLERMWTAFDSLKEEIVGV
ncbi:C2H2-type zinc finger protein [Phanerochaete sordida]|uniref:C2H2-type zinc finger protein n=1 Tax=Phanerochaete sordida TaxID=48140 RepID=A0A9P3GSI3_9APHY|nr:C2H2-type zinc finger protein [Phanerochaete sordida]